MASESELVTQCKLDTETDQPNDQSHKKILIPNFICEFLSSPPFPAAYSVQISRDRKVVLSQATSRSSWGIQRHSRTRHHVLYLWFCPEVSSQMDVHLSMQKSRSSPLSSFSISESLSMSPDNLWKKLIFTFWSWECLIQIAKTWLTKNSPRLSYFIFKLHYFTPNGSDRLIIWFVRSEMLYYLNKIPKICQFPLEEIHFCK